MSGDGTSSGARRPRAISRPRVPPGPLADLKALLYELYLAAGTPTLDEIAAAVAADDQLAGAPGRDTIARIIGDPGTPASQADVAAVTIVLARIACWDPGDAGRAARDLWVAARMTPAVGVPLAEVTDPFALEVHRPVLPEDATDGLPELPAYVPREHDQVLGEVVQAAAAGRSRIAVLVGGSSTGKTRACWEVLGLLRGRQPGWRVWHPIDPTRPDATLAELPRIGPRTVVWLNEAQFYLGVADGRLGERVASGLRELLRDQARAPVLVLATLWPKDWDTLTARPPGGADPHEQARELLAGHDIAVPAAFTAAQVGELTGSGDARLVLAGRLAADGEVTQFLAGAPELLARYRNAPPVAAALIHAAMDARRLGMSPGLPHAFLEHAAPGYLSDDQWDGLGENWLEQALAWAAVRCHGAAGPLTRIRLRPAASSAARSSPRDSGEQPEGGPPWPLYRLADYLDQHGRGLRKDQIPPPEFWAAAAAHARPAEQVVLGAAAHSHGLYRDAAQLHKNAAASGSFRSARYLSHPPACLSADLRPAIWAATHAYLDNPLVVAHLLDSLRETGPRWLAAALLRRDPAARVSLDYPLGVARLLEKLVGSILRVAGAHEQAATLAVRAAAHAALDDPGGVARLLDSLRETGAREQAAALVARDPAARVSLDDPGRVARLLDSLRKAGAQEQAAALAVRAAAGVTLDDPGGAADLLDSLRKAGAQGQAAALAARAAAHAALDNPLGVVRLLGGLRAAGATEQAAALAARVSLDDPEAVAGLLGWLRLMGPREQTAALLRRDPAARVSLDDPGPVARLLDSLREAGAREQAAALVARDPAARVSPYNTARNSLDNRDGVAWLLRELRAAGAQQQAAALTDRLPGVGMFELFLEQQERQDRFRFGREADGSPSQPWGWDDLD